MEEKHKHLSLSLLFALVLTFIGGFIELYSVRVRGVYAAMQTGNLINIFTNLIDGTNQVALKNFIVLAVFFLGCFIAEFIRHRIKDLNKYFNKIILILQALVLIVPICIPKTNPDNFAMDVIADSFIAIFGALQLCAFQSVNGNFYVSTMMTIVLKMITTHTSLAIKERKKEHLLTSLEYVAVLCSFVLGIIVFYLIYKYTLNNSNAVLIERLLLLIPLVLTLAVLLPLEFVISKQNEIHLKLSEENKVIREEVKEKKEEKAEEKK